MDGLTVVLVSAMVMVAFEETSERVNPDQAQKPVDKGRTSLVRTARM